ncbi:hypothetical protein [Enterococcus sp. AZ102]|uniref:hypothetical protein n=1 Tax=Enterococcus sp. AZ102 TaxID=2774865 RepID=UPI003F26F8D6
MTNTLLTYTQQAKKELLNAYTTIECNRLYKARKGHLMLSEASQFIMTALQVELLEEYSDFDTYSLVDYKQEYKHILALAMLKEVEETLHEELFNVITLNFDKFDYYMLRDDKVSFVTDSDFVKYFEYLKEK